MRILPDAAALSIAQKSAFTTFCLEPIDLWSGFDGEAANKKPIATFALGRIRAADCDNSADKGVVHNVNVELRYQDGDQWKSSTSFGRPT